MDVRRAAGIGHRLDGAEALGAVRGVAWSRRSPGNWDRRAARGRRGGDRRRTRRTARSRSGRPAPAGRPGRARRPPRCRTVPAARAGAARDLDQVVVGIERQRQRIERPLGLARRWQQGRGRGGQSRPCVGDRAPRRRADDGGRAGAWIFSPGVPSVMKWRPARCCPVRSAALSSTKNLFTDRFLQLEVRLVPKGSEAHGTHVRDRPGRPDAGAPRRPRPGDRAGGARRAAPSGPASRSAPATCIPRTPTSAPAGSICAAATTPATRNGARATSSRRSISPSRRGGRHLLWRRSRRRRADGRRRRRGRLHRRRRQAVDLEHLYAGWRSGDLLADSLGEDALDLSLGRQEFQVGDGFLIWDGNFDNAGDGAYWLGPRTAPST